MKYLLFLRFSSKSEIEKQQNGGTVSIASQGGKQVKSRTNKAGSGGYKSFVLPPKSRKTELSRKKYLISRVECLGWDFFTPGSSWDFPTLYSVFS